MFARYQYFNTGILLCLRYLLIVIFHKIREIVFLYIYCSIIPTECLGVLAGTLGYLEFYDILEEEQEEVTPAVSESTIAMAHNIANNNNLFGVIVKNFILFIIIPFNKFG